MRRIESRELRKPSVDSVFPLEEAAEAFRKGEAGHLKRKAVVELASS